MKSKFYVFLIFIIVILTEINVNAQTYKDKTITENILRGENLDPLSLASFGITTSLNVRNTEITGNSVFLSQIGEFNQVNVETRTQSSEIKITQNGDYNNTDLRYIANTAVSDLVQNGNFNSIKDYVNDPNIDISLDLKQEGDYLNFQREGVNDLTKSLRFIQTEASPSLIIRSYK